MNPCIKNLNRIEFLITLACTGRCIHCSEGDHTGCHTAIDADAAALLVTKAAANYNIQSLMTFGGEPMLHPETVYAIHRAAKDAGIPKRQLITNGFFSRDERVIRTAAERLIDCGVNDILLSADAFHQETIPLEPVRTFASAVKEAGGAVRISPAWLVGRDADNPYNKKTHEILAHFTAMGIPEGKGNVIFPSGNALKYLADYFDPDNLPVNPYEESPDDIRTISVEPDGSVLGGNIYDTDILTLIERYTPPAG